MLTGSIPSSRAPTLIPATSSLLNIATYNIATHVINTINTNSNTNSIVVLVIVCLASLYILDFTTSTRN